MIQLGGIYWQVATLPAPFQKLRPIVLDSPERRGFAFANTNHGFLLIYEYAID